MTSILIVHASRHGATAGIAERLGAVLRERGIHAVVVPAADMADPAPYDACVVGAGVYMGSWVRDGIDYLDRYATVLAGRPVWLFSSGPLPGSSREPQGPTTDPVEAALGPSTGPGSTGRQRVEALAKRIGPREHRVFDGAYDPASPPTTMAERIIRILPSSETILPPGDYRDWPTIEAWARDIARRLEPVAAD